MIPYLSHPGVHQGKCPASVIFDILPEWGHERSGEFRRVLKQNSVLFNRFHRKAVFDGNEFGGSLNWRSNGVLARSRIHARDFDRRGKLLHRIWESFNEKRINSGSEIKPALRLVAVALGKNQCR